MFVVGSFVRRLRVRLGACQGGVTGLRLGRVSHSVAVYTLLLLLQMTIVLSEVGDSRSQLVIFGQLLCRPEPVLAD